VSWPLVCPLGAGAVSVLTPTTLPQRSHRYSLPTGTTGCAWSQGLHQRTDAVREGPWPVGVSRGAGGVSSVAVVVSSRASEGVTPVTLSLTSSTPFSFP
jgi:hypothetical protein